MKKTKKAAPKKAKKQENLLELYDESELKQTVELNKNRTKIIELTEKRIIQLLEIDLQRPSSIAKQVQLGREYLNETKTIKTRSLIPHLRGLL